MFKEFPFDKYSPNCIWIFPSLDFPLLKNYNFQVFRKMASKAERYLYARLMKDKFLLRSQWKKDRCYSSAVFVCRTLRSKMLLSIFILDLKIDIMRQELLQFVQFVSICCWWRILFFQNMLGLYKVMAHSFYRGTHRFVTW